MKIPSYYKCPLTLTHTTALVLGVILLGANVGGTARIEVTQSSSSTFSPWTQLIEQRYTNLDPRQEPLDIEIVKRWEEDGIHYETLYFTGQVINGVKTRVYTLCGGPVEGDHLPGILYCHGAGATVDLQWVRFWAKRGYICVSFDYGGKTGIAPKFRSGYFTIWGEEVKKMIARRGTAPPLHRPAHGDRWYHNCFAARRALTLLEHTPRVDPNRIGALGVSNGGYMCWQIAVDRRIKTIVPIYGTGSPWRDKNARPVALGDDDEERERYLKHPDSPAYHAPLITCPVLFMSSTNDYYFDMDSAFDTIDRLGSSIVRTVFSPRTNHHIDPMEGRSLPLWMDWQLKGKGGPWPSSPCIEVLATGPVPQLRVRPDCSQEIDHVSIFYSLNTGPALTRFWRDAENLRRVGDVWLAETPYIDGTDTIVAFCNVVYCSGMANSSRPVYFDIVDLAGVKPTLMPQAKIDSMQNWRHFSWKSGYSNPRQYDHYFTRWIGPNGERGFTINPFKCITHPFLNSDGKTLNFSISTYKLNDPQWRGNRAQTAIMIDYAAWRVPVSLIITLDERVENNGKKSYHCRIPVEDQRENGKDWITLRLVPARFIDEAGNPLRSFAGVEALMLKGEAQTNNPPVFRNLCWELPAD